MFLGQIIGVSPSECDCVCVYMCVWGVPTGVSGLHIKVNSPPRQAFNLTAATINVFSHTNVVDGEYCWGAAKPWCITAAVYVSFYLPYKLRHNYSFTCCSTLTYIDLAWKKKKWSSLLHIACNWTVQGTCRTSAYAVCTAVADVLAKSFWFTLLLCDLASLVYMDMVLSFKFKSFLRAF